MKEKIYQLLWSNGEGDISYGIYATRQLAEKSKGVNEDKEPYLTGLVSRFRIVEREVIV